MHNRRNVKYTSAQQIKYIKKLIVSIKHLHIKNLPQIVNMVLQDAIILERLNLEELDFIVSIMKKTLSDEHVRINNMLLREDKDKSPCIIYKRRHKGELQIIFPDN